MTAAEVGAIVTALGGSVIAASPLAMVWLMIVKAGSYAFVVAGGWIAVRTPAAMR